MTDYGFAVQQQVDWNDPEYQDELAAFIASRPEGSYGWMVDPARPLPPKTDRWTVELPHQCDEWVIAEGEHTAAVAAMEEFIRQAQVALGSLLDRRESAGTP